MEKTVKPVAGKECMEVAVELVFTCGVPLLSALLWLAIGWGVVGRLGGVLRHS